MKTIKSHLSLLSLIKFSPTVSIQNRIFTRFKTVAAVSVVTGFTLINISGCQPQSTEAISQPQMPKLNGIVNGDVPKKAEDETLTTSKQKNSHSHSFEPHVVQPAGIENNAEVQAKALVESLKLNQARLAAKRHDKCPKLVIPKVDSNRIVRNHELLKAQYCDYYIYPKQGEVLSIETDPSYLQAELVAPTLHNFKNGSYQVANADKHVIRILSTNDGYRETPIEYDVTMTLQRL